MWTNTLDSCSSSPGAIPTLPQQLGEGQVQQAAVVQEADASSCMPVRAGVVMLDSMPADGSSRWSDPQILQLHQHLQQQPPEGMSEHCTCHFAPGTQDKHQPLRCSALLKSSFQVLSYCKNKRATCILAHRKHNKAQRKPSPLATLVGRQIP